MRLSTDAIPRGQRILHADNANHLPTMTPTQIANLEAEYIQRARMAKEFNDHAIAAAWEAAASLLIQASSKPARRRTRRFNESFPVGYRPAP